MAATTILSAIEKRAARTWSSLSCALVAEEPLVTLRVERLVRAVSPFSASFVLLGVLAAVVFAARLEETLRGVSSTKSSSLSSDSACGVVGCNNRGEQLL